VEIRKRKSELRVISDHNEKSELWISIVRILEVFTA